MVIKFVWHLLARLLFTRSNILTEKWVMYALQLIIFNVYKAVQVAKLQKGLRDIFGGF